jgi:hypothetical protein
MSEDPRGPQPGWVPQQDQYPQPGQQPYGQQSPLHDGHAPGYGPPPPPHRKRHLARNILAGFGALVIVIIAIAALSSKGGVSTTPSGGATGTAAPARAAAAVIGSSFRVSDDNGDAYRVILAKVIDPAQGADSDNTPDNGKRFVGTVFTITALTGSPQDEDANNDAAIIGSNGQTYTADFDGIAGYTNFNDGSIDVAQGETVRGAVTFQVPDGVKVAEVQWTPGGFSATVQWKARQ